MFENKIVQTKAALELLNKMRGFDSPGGYSTQQGKKKGG